MIDRSELVTTGDAARILGVTTQHVRNLCDRGQLQFFYVGTHRRIRYADLRHLQNQSVYLTRDQLRNLWLHQAVAGKLVTNPVRILNLARTNLANLRAIHPLGAVTNQFEQWEKLLNGTTVRLLNTLTSTSADAIELRQNSPFAGALQPDERTQVLDSFRCEYLNAS